jgi:hypothetical protein
MTTITIMTIAVEDTHDLVLEVEGKEKFTI